MTVVVISLVVTGVLIGWGIHASAQQKARRDTLLGELARRLQGRADPAGYAIGDVGGTHVRFEYTTRGSGSSTEYWTYVDAEVPPYPLRMFVRRHGWRDQGKIDRGEMIDVAIGSPAFDAAFLVEAAPADVVKRLFDHDAMTYLLGEPAQLELTAEAGAQRTLRLALRRWIIDLAEAEVAIDCLVRIARRVREAYAEVETETAPRPVGSPYRPELDEQPARAAAERRQAEIEHLDRVRAARVSRSQLVAVMVLVGIVCAAVMLLAAVR